MTRYGQLYNYAFDAESPRYDWTAIDKCLFEVGYTGGQEWRDGVLIPDILRMISEQFELPLSNVWRVSVLPNGMVELNDFTMPSNTGKIRESFKQEDLPRWVQDSLSVLMIVDQGATVEGVGKKITDSIFYLLETPEIGEVYGNET